MSANKADPAEVSTTDRVMKGQSHPSVQSPVYDILVQMFPTQLSRSSQSPRCLMETQGSLELRLL